MLHDTSTWTVLSLCWVSRLEMPRSRSASKSRKLGLKKMGKAVGKAAVFSQAAKRQ